MSGDTHAFDTPLADQQVEFKVGITEQGQVLLDFGARQVDHLKLTPFQALELAEYMVETAKQAAHHGRVIETGKRV